MKNVREQDKPLFEKYFEINERYKEKVLDNENPRFPANNGGVNIECFDPTSCSTSNINNHSIVTVLSYAKRKVILTGDNEPPSWKELLGKTSFVNAIKGADVLLAPHHGRDSGFHKELFSYFSPYLTIISDGRFCDTSATDRYDDVTKGWKVHYRSGGEEKRYCLTTRNDGYVVIKLGYDSDKKPYFNVTARGKK